jgi:hypothetical protein
VYQWNGSDPWESRVRRRNRRDPSNPTFLQELRLSNIFHRKAKPAQEPIAEQGPSSAIKGQAEGHIPETEDSSQAPMMSTNIPSTPPSSDQYLLYCVIEGEQIVFGVPVSANSDVSGLKKLIYDERSLDTLRDVGRHTLELWKVCASDS